LRWGQFDGRDREKPEATGAVSVAARHALRVEKSKPLLDQIKVDLEAARAGSLPHSALAKACQYTLALWPRLTRFLDYPEVELSTNLAENSMRGIALGRRNWIRVGSERARPKVAALLSVVETCRRLKLPVRDYLGAVLPGLANFPIRPSPNSRRALGRLPNRVPELPNAVKVVDGHTHTEHRVTNARGEATPVRRLCAHLAPGQAERWRPAAPVGPGRRRGRGALAAPGVRAHPGGQTGPRPRPAGR